MSGSGTQDVTSVSLSKCPGDECDVTCINYSHQTVLIDKDLFDTLHIFWMNKKNFTVPKKTEKVETTKNFSFTHT